VHPTTVEFPGTTSLFKRPAVIEPPQNHEEPTMSMENDGLAIDDWDAPIYRTYSLEYALALFKSGTNGLVHPSRWDDPFENFFLKNGAVDENGNLVALDEVHKDFYGQCWTIEEESDALWRIYSQAKGGVCISTTIRKLFESILQTHTRRKNTLSDALNTLLAMN
jgi:hypothetical protein